MDLTEGSALGVFSCELCEISSPYSFYGQKPPNTRAIVLLEECYGIKDPFRPEREKFVILGSKCCLCNKTVCVGTVRSTCDSHRKLQRRCQNPKTNGTLEDCLKHTN